MSHLAVAPPKFSNGSLNSKVTKPNHASNGATRRHPPKGVIHQQQQPSPFMRLKEQLKNGAEAANGSHVEKTVPREASASRNLEGSNLPVSQSSDEEQSQSDDGSSSSENDLENPLDYIPNNVVQEEYREYLIEFGIMKFLNRYVPNKMHKQDVIEMILDLGYTSFLKDVETASLTASQTALLLIQALASDKSLRENQPFSYMISSDSDDSSSASSIGSSPMKPISRIQNDQDFNPYRQQPIPKKDPYTMDKFFRDLVSSKRIMVITGAGISTSLGIPDFRSFQGLYSQLTHLNLSDPQQVFDIEVFNNDPSIFYSIAHLVLPPESNFSVLHAFLKMIQDKGKLLRNYTQNIDDLETKAGITDENLIQCHGSFRTAACVTCGTHFDGSKIHDHIRKQRAPRCFKCFAPIHDEDEVAQNFGVIKPSITFFGEDLPKRYHDSAKSDCKKCDLVLVIGTSLKVDPVASLIFKIPSSVPKVLINKDDIADRDFDLRLLGNSDDVASYISKHMGPEWSIKHAAYDAKNNVQAKQHAKYRSVYNFTG